MRFISKKMEASIAAGGHDAEEHHVLPLPLYFAVFGALLVLTVITVGVSLLGLPAQLAIAVAMAVASVKAALVVLYFMHLRYDAKFYSFIFIASLFFIALFFVFTIGDMASRGLVIPEQATEVWRNEQLAIKKEKAQADGTTGGVGTDAAAGGSAATGSESNTAGGGAPATPNAGDESGGANSAGEKPPAEPGASGAPATAPDTHGNTTPQEGGGTTENPMQHPQ